MTGRRRQTAPECDLYIPGHMVHWIQARKASEHPRTWGLLEGVRGQVITVRFLDRVALYRNHQADAVLEDAQVGAEVRVSERYGLLSIPLENGEIQSLCVADAAGPWRPCNVAPSDPVSFEELIERATDRGGFVIPGALLKEMAEDRNDLN